ncbi:transmembrane 9 superfamily member 3 [Schistosoma bovis]|uniref:Transmembrane 9 superfamily member n=1 Tax=Schistosoma bovis TaxID=6184 RepID=A0A430QHC8_SCHBO|nr:transmembrane 9 superfamily member 3 [Schistosoma bovis]
MRTLRRDYARYNKEDGLSDLDRELGDEYGWKQVHGDVFRSPPHSSLLASLVGTGIHIAVVSSIVLFLALTNKLYTERGSFISTAIFVFASTSPVNGLVGGSLYARMSANFPCRVNPVPKAIPEKKWFMEPSFSLLQVDYYRLDQFLLNCNGQVFFLVHRSRFMHIYIRFTTTSSKPTLDCYFSI